MQVVSTDSNAEAFEGLLISSSQGLFVGILDRAALTVALASYVDKTQASLVASHIRSKHLSLSCYLLPYTFSLPLAVMAPKAAASAAEKKPAPAKKAVAKKSTGGRKKGFKKAVESYKIYIYKVCRSNFQFLVCDHNSGTRWSI